jgi:uncharacterized protein (TIGR02301 family)
MKGPAPRPLALGFGFCLLAVCVLAWAPVAEAQYFWSPWFQDQPRRPKPRASKPAAPAGYDLPPIVPRESSVPPPPDDRPYDTKLLRLAEVLGAVHYLRELCGAQEGQLWRDQMKEILKNEGSTAVRRAKLVNSFNDGYRGYRRTYRSCTSSATVAITRFSTEGAQIAAALAQPSHYASRNAPDQTATPSANEQAPPPANKDETNKGEANKGEAKPGEATPGEAKPAEANRGEPKPAEAKPAEANKPEATTGAIDQSEPNRHEKHKGKKADHAAPAEASQSSTDQFPGINR